MWSGDRLSKMWLSKIESMVPTLVQGVIRQKRGKGDGVEGTPEKKRNPKKRSSTAAATTPIKTKKPKGGAEFLAELAKKGGNDRPEKGTRRERRDQTA